MEERIVLSASPASSQSPGLSREFHQGNPERLGGMEGRWWDSGVELGGSRGGESEWPVLGDRDVPSALRLVAGEYNTGLPGLLRLVALRWLLEFIPPLERADPCRFTSESQSELRGWGKPSHPPPL